MLEQVKSFITTHNLLPSKQQNVLIGMSGGADSVALLHILTELGYTCKAAHCNFHLRGEESNRDELFVRNLCKMQDIELYSINFETIEYAKQEKISIEMAARKLRYDWFEKIRVETGCQAIAVAHHANDNTETVLLNMIRGTGIRGLKGIQAHNGYIVRPLLSVTRSAIEHYLHQHSLTYVTDSTNFENEYSRNKIRNQIIPVLQEINPSLINTFTENSQRLESSLRIYEQFIETKRKQIVYKKNESVFIDIRLLQTESEISTLLYEFCREYGFHFSQTEAIIKSLGALSGKKWFAPDYQLAKDRNTLIINKINKNNHCEEHYIYDAGQFFEPISISIKIFSITTDFKISRQQRIVHFDADKVSFPLKIRQVQKADYFIPFGMKGRKKISDFLIDQKINIFDKEKVYLLLSGDDIMWVIGHRTDNRFRITESTRSVLEISLP